MKNLEAVYTDVPFAQVESERAKRGKHAARLFACGINTFRLDHARGVIVRVTSVDPKAGKAMAVGLRQRVHSVALCDLYPMGDANA